MIILLLDTASTVLLDKLVFMDYTPIRVRM